MQLRTEQTGDTNNEGFLVCKCGECYETLIADIDANGPILVAEEDLLEWVKEECPAIRVA